MGRGLAGTGRPGRVPGKRFLRSELWRSALAQNSSCFPPPPNRLSDFSLILSFFPQDSDMLACHNYWHWALYLIEKVR